MLLLKTSKALNGLLCADVSLRNYSVTHSLSCMAIPNNCQQLYTAYVVYTQYDRHWKSFAVLRCTDGQTGFCQRVLQGCFAIDYDFATHKCYFFAVNLWTEQIPTTATPEPVFYRQIFFHCPISAATKFPSLNTIPNPTVVHITFCEFFGSIHSSIIKFKSSLLSDDEDPRWLKIQLHVYKFTLLHITHYRLHGCTLSVGFYWLWVTNGKLKILIFAVLYL